MNIHRPLPYPGPSRHWITPRLTENTAMTTCIDMTPSDGIRNRIYRGGSGGRGAPMRQVRENKDIERGRSHTRSHSVSPEDASARQELLETDRTQITTLPRGRHHGRRRIRHRLDPGLLNTSPERSIPGSVLPHFSASSSESSPSPSSA